MKILIVSDTATHPVVAGNRARIVALAETMQTLGHSLEFLFLPRQAYPYDANAAREFWSDGYYEFIEQPPVWKKFAHNLLPRPLWKAVAKLWRKQRKPAPGRVWKIDDWYKDSWNPFVGELARRVRPDVVIVEYVYMSKALEAIPPGALKVIDTHDKFTDRDRLYLDTGRKPVFFYTTEEQEAKGLKRADRIIAITEEERQFFQRISGTPSFCVSHPVKVMPTPDCEELSVGFLGSGNHVNQMGLEWLLASVWPQVTKQISNAVLRIAGSLCEYIPEAVVGPNVQRMGMVDLPSFYRSLAVVVNPLQGGTGQKIKLIEALGYGKAVVTTSHGATGLENSAGQAFKMVDDPEAFAREICRLLWDLPARKALGEEAIIFCNSYNEVVRARLAAVFEV